MLLLPETLPQMSENSFHLDSEFFSNLNILVSFSSFLNVFTHPSLLSDLLMSFLKCSTHEWNKIFKLPSDQARVYCRQSDIDYQLYLLLCFAFPSPFPPLPFLNLFLLLLLSFFLSLPLSLYLSISLSRAKCCL